MSNTSDLRKLKTSFSPDKNPLAEKTSVPMRKRFVQSKLAGKTLVDTETGQLEAASVIHQIEEKDTDEFVKVFSAGIAASYNLTKTGQRVFQAVLQEYEKTPMTRGFADTVYLAWFDGGLAGRDLEMHERTFNRGLRELLEKGFIAPKLPNVYWVNPALFFKGDRVMFVKEYRKKAKGSENQNELGFD